MNVKWGYVFLVIGAVVVMAYNRQIAAALRPLRIGEFWSAFCGQLGAMPPLGKYAVVLMVLGLLYLTTYFLVREWMGRR